MEKLKEQGVKGLRYLERYTKTDMVYLAKGGFWLGLGQIVSSGSALLTSIAFANLISPTSFGFYKYILSINSLLLISTLSGMDSAVAQATATGFEGTLSVATKEKTKWGTVGSAVSLSVALYYFFQGNNTLAIAFCITSLFVPLTESFDMYNSLLWGKKLFNVQAIYSTIKKVIALLAIVTTLFLTKNIFIILLVYFLSITIPNIFIYSRVKNKYQENNSVEPNSISYGKKLSGINIISVILGELDKVLVFHYLGAINLAIYSLAISPTDQLKGLMKNLNSLAFPRFSNKNLPEIKKALWSKMKILFIITTAIVAVYIVISPIFFKVFLPKYTSSIIYSQIFSLSLIPVILAGFIYTILESQKATTEIYKYNLYSNTINIIVLFPLIYLWGLWGAIAARIINRLVVLVIATSLISKEY